MAYHIMHALALQFTGSARCPPDVILRRSFTRPSTALAVIEGLGMSLNEATFKEGLL